MSTYSKLHKILAKPLRAIFSLEVEGESNIEEGKGFLLCANHTGLLDVIVLAVSMRRQPMFMAKKELFKIPLLKQLITALGAFPVDRKGSDVGAIRNTIGLIEKGQIVGMFPQGTRHPNVDPRTTEVKNGAGMIAYRTKCDVIPVYIKTKNNHTMLFRKAKVIFGAPIKYEEFAFTNGGTAEYKAASEKIFDRICTLGEGKEDK